MNIVFVSNILNHHQVAFCEALKKRCKVFHFIATQDVENIGFQTSTDAEYVVKHYVKEEKLRAETLIMNADVVIFGNCPNYLIEKRMKENKLSFLFSERFFKKGVWRRFIPHTYKAIKDRIANYNDKNIYVLCASAYLPYDLSFFSFPNDKCLKWGYFPETRNYGDIEDIIKSKTPSSILWAARLIDWKHPEVPVKVAKLLKKNGYKFKMNLIGSGALKNDIQKLIDRYDLSDYVCLAGSMSPEKVRELMEKAEIFLFTSDRNEGWGAVLNEAMNSGCAVVASHIIGSVPFLINDLKNGLIYNDGSLSNLYKKVKWLLDNPAERSELGRKAYKTITEQWNAETAAERFYALVESFLHDGKISTFSLEGLCSKAELLRDNWYN